jgi:hypothetical protein
MKIKTIFKTKIVLIIIQFLILTLVIYSFNHFYQITFESETTIEQRAIIQFLANYVTFDDINSMIFMYVLWMIVSLIPITIYFDLKKAYSTNLSTFFLLNFFFYVFLYWHSRNFFDSHFPFFIIKTLLLGSTIVVFSIGLSIGLNQLKKHRKKQKQEQSTPTGEKSLMICPKCGTEFQSIPMFCYNCDTKLTNGEDLNSEI